MNKRKHQRRRGRKLTWLDSVVVGPSLGDLFRDDSSGNVLEDEYGSERQPSATPLNASTSRFSAPLSASLRTNSSDSETEEQYEDQETGHLESNPNSELVSPALSDDNYIRDDVDTGPVPGLEEMRNEGEVAGLGNIYALSEENSLMAHADPPSAFHRWTSEWNTENSIDEMKVNANCISSRTPESTQLERLRKHRDRITLLKVLAKRNVLLSWERLFGVVSVCGSVRLTVRQYETLRTMAMWLRPDSKLPSYSAVQRTIFPFILTHSFPRSENVALPVTHPNARKRNRGSSTITRAEYLACQDSGPSKKKSRIAAQSWPDDHDIGIKAVSREEQEQARSIQVDDRTDMRSPVKVVLPSEWAKMDISMHPFFTDIFPTFGLMESQDQVADPGSIEGTRIVRDRKSLMCTTPCLFAHHNGMVHRVVPGMTIQVTVTSIPFHSERIPSQSIACDIQSTRRDIYVLSGIVIAIWTVGSTDRPSQSGVCAVSSVETSAEKDLITALLTAPSLADQDIQVQHDGTEAVLPGDVCSLFRSNRVNPNSTFQCVLVSRFWKHQEGVPSEQVVWIDSNSELDSLCEYQDIADELPFKFMLPASVALHVKLSPVMAESEQRLREKVQEAELPIPRSFQHTNTGVLESGERYVVYRVLLYCDDFQPYSSLLPNGSAGGCYLLPVGLSPRNRRSRASVRTISLTPPGVSTSAVLSYIVSDLVKSATNGIDGYTPAGDPVKIFIDVVAYVADYPAAAHAVDVIGHVGSSPCTHCTFRRADGLSSSKFGYTVRQHSQSTSSLRCAERHSALRNAGIRDNHANYMGMSKTTVLEAQNKPLLYLHEQLDRVRSDIPRNNAGNRVVSGIFDPYRSSVVAPDHLLTGLAKNSIATCFNALPSKQMQKLADTLICAGLRENGLLPQSSVFDKKLHSMKLSEIYCVLLVSVPVFRLTLGCNERPYMLVQILQSLIGLTFWWPEELVDDQEAVAYVLSDGGLQYLQDLQALAQDYVRMADEYITGNPDTGKELDKPNLHRTLELYFHTIPSFGHARHIMELVFECAHAPLKRCVARSNNHNAHISAVEHVLGNDWQARLALLHYHITDGDPKGHSNCKRGLRRLVLGPEMDSMPENDETCAMFLKEVDEKIKGVFVMPVLKELRADGKVSAAWSGVKAGWIAGQKLTIDERKQQLTGDCRYTVEQLLNYGCRVVGEYYPDFGKTKHAPKLYGRAKRVRRTSLTSAMRAYQHDVISLGCVVQALVPFEKKRDTVIIPGDGKPTLFAVVGVVSRDNGEEPWAVTIRCRDLGGNRLMVRGNIETSCLQVLKLTAGVRRVGIYHDCGNYPRGGCVVSDEGLVIHTETLFGNGIQLYQTRKEGYPPRMA